MEIRLLHFYLAREVLLSHHLLLQIMIWMMSRVEAICNLALDYTLKIDSTSTIMMSTKCAQGPWLILYGVVFESGIDDSFREGGEMAQGFGRKVI